MHAQVLASSHRAEMVEQQAERRAVREQEEISAFKAAAQSWLAESEQQYQRKFAAEKASAEAAFVDEMNRRITSS